MLELNNIIIKLASETEADLIADLLHRLAQEIGDGDIIRSTPQTVQKAAFGSPRHIYVLLAMSPEKAVGMCVFYSIYSTTRACPGVYILDLWIDPAARGKGIGQKMIKACGEFSAQAWGASYIGLTVYSNNAKARQFYEKMGFRLGEKETSAFFEEADFNRMIGNA